MKEKDSPLIRQDWKLIRQYVNKGSQTAFAELSARYVNMVYTICLRETRQPQLAEDAAQAVFLVFAQKCKTFRPGIILSTWLFAVCRLTCRNALRAQRRQAKWEEKAAQDMLTQNSTETERWREIEPHLDDAIASLNHRERDLILLRFFEDQSLEEVGQTLGLSPDAARMGVNRAVEKLRQRLVKHGAQAAGVTLAPLLAAHSVQAAPADFASNALVQSATVGATAGTSVHVLAKGVLKTMSIIKSTIIATALAGIAGVSLVAIIGAHALRPVTPEQLVAVAPTKSDPKALAILQQMADAYAKLTSYSDTETEQGEEHIVPKRLVVNYSRPAGFEIESTDKNTAGKIETIRALADQQYSYVTTIPSGQSYIRRPLHKSKSVIVSVLRAARIQEATSYIPGLLDNPQKWLSPELDKTIVFQGDPETDDGVTCDTVIITLAISPDKNYTEVAIGRADHLLRKIREYDAGDGKSPGTDFSVSINDVRVNRPLPDTTFQFVPPPDMARTDIGMHIDPKANSVLKAMYDTYNGLHSFACTEDITAIRDNPNSSPRTNVSRDGHMTYVIEKLNLVSFDIQDGGGLNKTDIQIVSNGSTVYIQGTGPRWKQSHYVKQILNNSYGNANKTLNDFATYAGDWNGSVWMPAVPLGYDILSVNNENDYDLIFEEPTTIHGEPVDRIFMPRHSDDPGDKLTVVPEGDLLYVSQRDHLLRQIDCVTCPSDGSIMTVTHIFTNIQTNPSIDKSCFMFTPKTGSTAVSDLWSVMQH